ncbi:MAG: carboxypeptidase-like regulatory domain-containing protein [Cyclobacteriaceae bacterium]
MAQPRVKYTIVDSVTKEPVAYATIRCPDLTQVFAANVLGEFVVTPEKVNHQYVVSGVGYKSTSFLATADKGNVTVYLAPSVTEMNEVVVMASKPSEQARKIVAEALNQLDKRAKGFSAHAFLHHTIKQNESFVKLLDAELFFQDEKGYKGKIRPEFVQERITYLQKRESLDFASDRADFQRSYFDFYYNEFAFLLKNGLKYDINSHRYDFYVEQTEELENEIRYEISAFDKTNIRPGEYYEIFDITYEIFIDKHTGEHFIKSYELNYKNSLSKKFLKHNESSFFKIQLRKSGDSVVPEYIEHFLLQATQFDPHAKPSLVEAFHHLTFEAPTQQKNIKPIKNNVYHVDYWKDKPIDPEITKDLSRYIGLEKQFSFQHLPEVQQTSQERVSKNIIDAFIGENSNQSVYLVLWNTPESIVSFLNAPDQFDQQKVKLVFIGGIDSFRSWAFIVGGNGTMFYPQFNLPTMIKNYLPDGATLPCYVLKRKSGELIHKKLPLNLTMFE